MTTQKPAGAPTADNPLTIMLAHNHWANVQLLEACRPLTHEQFHRKFPIGLGDKGGLHLSLTHIISAAGRWADRIRGVMPVRAALEPMPFVPPPGWPTPDIRDRSVDELLELNVRFSADLQDAAVQSVAKGLGSTVEVSFPGKDGVVNRVIYTRGAALAHVLTHGHYHRAQCMNMLRHLNVPGVSDKLPMSSVMEWQSAGEPGL